jgi:hypothetical protein
MKVNFIMLKPFKKVFKNVRIRKLIASAVLVWSLLKSSRFASLDSSSQKQNNSVIYSLQNSNILGPISETGTGTILIFKQKAHDLSLNEQFHLLQEDDSQVILVKAGDSSPSVSTPTPTGKGQPSNFLSGTTGGHRTSHFN